MHVQLAEDLGRVEEVLVFEDPVRKRHRQHADLISTTPLMVIHQKNILFVLSLAWRFNILLPIPRRERDIQQQWQPIPINQEQGGEECVDAGFGNDVHVEAIAKVDGVDVVAFEIGVHDGEEDLQEEVHCVEQDREEKQPKIKGPALASDAVVW